MASSGSNDGNLSPNPANQPQDRSPLSSSGGLDFRSLYSEIAQMRPRSSHAIHSIRSSSPPTWHDIQHTPSRPKPKIDLRALEYVSDYDSQLMCPICHIPFIDPVSLNCEHYFCRGCFKEFWESIADGEQRRCPSCREPITQEPHRASRLIINMCDDLEVRCPNSDCKQVMARAYVERHATTDCGEERLPCPTHPSCMNTRKRKHIVPYSCSHQTHIECDCGRLVQDIKWPKHNKEECPSSGGKCDKCGTWVPVTDAALGRVHVCHDTRQKCPGQDFGCSVFLEPEELELHIQQCALARLAPHLNSQAAQISDIRTQLSWTKSRNQILESGFERFSDILGESPPPAGNNLPSSETRRSPLSPLLAGGPGSEQEESTSSHTYSPRPVESTLSSSGPTSQQHLLALHESLRTAFTKLESDLNTLSVNMADQDARNSMLIMNETLRIKEDIAHTNAALFSTRAQVQWLLNRERAGQQLQQQQIGAIRGRAPPAGTGGTNSSASSGMTEQSENGTTMGQGVSAGSLRVETSTSGSGGGVTMTGPAVAATAVAAMAMGRSVRRPSGGSQERVKL